MKAHKRPAPGSWTTRQMVSVAMFVCLAMVLSYIERLIPLSFTIPGVKLGLANLVVLSGLYLLAFRQAFTLVILKCVLTAWIFGSFSAFLYSAAGSLLSFFVMAALLCLAGGKRGEVAPVGVVTVVVSMVGGVAHNLGQILMAALVVGSFKVLYYLPVLLGVGLLTGFFIGVCVRTTLLYIRERKEEL